MDGSKTICIECGHRPHASPCLICVCGWPKDQWPMPDPEQELAREAVRQARRDEMRKPPRLWHLACPQHPRCAGCFCEQAS